MSLRKKLYGTKALIYKASLKMKTPLPFLSVTFLTPATGSYDPIFLLAPHTVQCLTAWITSVSTSQELEGLYPLTANSTRLSPESNVERLQMFDFVPESQRVV
jgi:hypothetical protein